MRSGWTGEMGGFKGPTYHSIACFSVSQDGIVQRPEASKACTYFVLFFFFFFYDPVMTLGMLLHLSPSQFLENPPAILPD